MSSNNYQLTDDLARLCLPSAYRDPNRKLAWVNSICIFFLLVGIFGAKPSSRALEPVPPIEEIAPVMFEPVPPQPRKITATQNEDEPEPQPSVAPRVVVVVPDTPDLQFSVPTIGNLLAPSALAQAPPLRPLEGAKPVTQPAELANTGAGGDRPQPPYPKIALEQAQQGTVTVLMSADSLGNVASIQIATSSGFPVLDRATAEFIKRHWTLPSGAESNQLFEASITYQLQPD